MLGIRFKTKIKELKETNMTQFLDKSTDTNWKLILSEATTIKRHHSSILQRLRANLERSDGVRTVTQLVWVTDFTGSTFPFIATDV